MQFQFLKNYFVSKKDAELAANFRSFFIKIFGLVVLFIIAFWAINRNQKKQLLAGQWISQTKDVMYQVEKVVSLVKDYETSSRGFVIAGTDDFLTPVANTKDSAVAALGDLKKLVKDSPVQQKAADSLLLFMQKRFSISDSTIQLRKAGNLAEALALVSSGIGKRYMDTIRVIENNITVRESHLLKKQNEDNDKAITDSKITLWICLLLFFTLLIILFWQAWFNLRNYNSRQIEINKTLVQLTNSLQNAQRVAKMGSWEWNVSTDEQKWSDEQYRIFGYEPQFVQPSHKVLIDAVHYIDRPIVEREIAAALEKRQPYDINFLIVQPSGNIRHVNLLGQVYFENEKEVIIAGTVQDITPGELKS
jgi:PAS domain S-box-containing protein